MSSFHLALVLAAFGSLCGIAFGEETARVQDSNEVSGTCSCVGRYPVANQTDSENWYRCMEIYPLPGGGAVTSPGYIHTMLCDNPITGNEMPRGGLKNVVRSRSFAYRYPGHTRGSCAVQEATGFEAPYQL